MGEEQSSVWGQQERAVKIPFVYELHMDVPSTFLTERMISQKIRKDIIVETTNKATKFGSVSISVVRINCEHTVFLVFG